MRRCTMLLATIVILLGLGLHPAIARPRRQATAPPITAYLPNSLPLDDAACFRIAGDGVLDFPALVARFPGVPDAAARLQALGWEEGAYRQFACDAPPNGVGWVDLSVHRFRTPPRPRPRFRFSRNRTPSAPNCSPRQPSSSAMPKPRLPDR